MQHFKKALLVTSAFVLAVLFFTFPFVWGTLHNDAYTDREAREELTGKLDYLIVGASQGLRSLKPSILDETLGCNSYNLCGVLTTFNGREALLNEELERNNIKTVVIEISRDAMGRSAEALEGDMFILSRLSSFCNSVKYFFKNVSISQWDYVYYYYFNMGARNLVHKIKQINVDTVNDKGYIPELQKDVAIAPQDVYEIHNSITMEFDTNLENVNTLERMIAAIQAENAQVYIVVIPLSDHHIWEVENWADFEASLAELSTLLGVKIIDFNLLKSRYKVINDKTSFYDTSHMSDEGATAFSYEYCKIMNLIEEGQNVDDLFYGTYAEMKQDSPYNK